MAHTVWDQWYASFWIIVSENDLANDSATMPIRHRRVKRDCVRWTPIVCWCLGISLRSSRCFQTIFRQTFSCIEFPHTVESPPWNPRHKLVGFAPQWDHPNFVIFYYQTSIWVFIRTWLIFLLWIANFVYRRFRTSFSWTLRCYIATCSTVSMKTFHKVHQSEGRFFKMENF